jgi:hypothetical protein
VFFFCFTNLTSSVYLFARILQAVSATFIQIPKKSVRRIRDVYPGSGFFPSRIPNPNCLHPGSRILIKEFKYFNPKKGKKNGFYALKTMIRVVHPGSRIRMLTFSHPGSRGQKGTQSRIPDSQHCKKYFEKKFF